MSNGQMTTGQLYRVGVTCINAHERCGIEFLVIASSNEDAKAKLPWVYDFSGWSSFRVDWTVKEPGKCLVLKQKFERIPENEPDASIKRNGGSAGVFQKVEISGGKKFEVVAYTVLFAKSVDHAKKKMLERIEGGSDFVKFKVEELGESSAFAVARDVSVYPMASFVRG
jgi:hypothetical protein